MNPGIVMLGIGFFSQVDLFACVLRQTPDPAGDDKPFHSMAGPLNIDPAEELNPTGL
jgi:hypothetical protein